MVCEQCDTTVDLLGLLFVGCRHIKDGKLHVLGLAMTEDGIDAFDLLEFTPECQRIVAEVVGTQKDPTASVLICPPTVSAVVNFLFHPQVFGPADAVSFDDK